MSEAGESSRSRDSRPAGGWADDSPVELSGVLEPDLSRALLMMLRVLRAGRGMAKGRAEPMALECVRWLSAIVERYGEVRLRVSVDGLSLGAERVVECSPQHDPAVFRLFQHGVRQLSFHPGLTRDDLFGLFDVLTTDLASVENVEEDVATLLTDKGFDGIQFVVVETFSETDQPSADKGSRDRDVSSIMSAALVEKLSADPDFAKGTSSGGTIRFWSADVKFLEGADLPNLLKTLPRKESARAASALEDQEIAAFAQGLRDALDRWVEALPGAAFAVAARGSVADRDAVLATLAGQLALESSGGDLEALSGPLGQVARWIEAQSSPEAAEQARRALFTPPIRAAALKTVARPSAALEPALAALSVLPEAELEQAARDLAAFQPSPRRDEALGALVRRRSARSDALAAELVGSGDAGAALQVLLSAAPGRLEGASLAVHQVALGHRSAEVRARALHRLAHDGGDHAASSLAGGLRDDDAAVRSTALHCLATVRSDIGVALLKSWMQSSAFARLEMEDKRTGALVLGRLGGPALLPAFRKMARKLNVTGSQRSDEVRAAAVACLGLLADAESVPLLEKLGKARLCGSALRDEARHVLSALRSNAPAYRDPLGGLRARLVQLGLAEPEPGEAAGPPSRPSVAPRASTVPPRASTVPPRASPVPPRASTVPPRASTAPPRAATVPPGPPPDEATAVQSATRWPASAPSPIAEVPPRGHPAVDLEVELAADGPTPGSGEPSEDLVAELLSSYSFDDMGRIDED